MVFLARPGQLLVEHSKNVFQIAQNYIRDSGIDIENFEEVTKRICFFHDFGKYTTYFQKKLEGQDRSKYSRHSFISAVVTAASILEFVDQKGLTDVENWLNFAPLIGYISVLAHHDNLTSIDENLPEYDFCLGESNSIGLQMRENYDIAQKQLKDIMENIDFIINDYKSLEMTLPEILFDKEGIKKILCRLDELYHVKYQRKTSEETKQYVAVLTQLSYSLLIDSDKKDAAGYVIEERVDIPKELVKHYKETVLKAKQKKLSDKIVKIREELFDNVLKNVENIQIPENTGLQLRITAPTGAGKTLTVLNAALILRSKVFEKYGRKPRIIYALPFVSIIEQTKSVLEQVLGQIEEFAASPEKFFIAHYHLAEAIEMKEEIKGQSSLVLEDTYYLQNQFFIESWDSEIVLTTFWQFFHTLLGYRNKLMKKFYKLFGSVIILDEPQSIQAELWPLVEKFLNMLTKYMKANIIMISATQPAFVKNWKELNHEYKSMFYNLNRTELHVLKSHSKDFLDVVNYVLEQNSDKNSFLFVFNTVRDSIEKYYLIKDIFSKSSNTQLFYLSTNIIPKDRMERLIKLQEALLAEKRVVLVSSQVVEAGVDLDFDVVIREIGPLSSIIQVAGRCNRNYRIEKARIYLTNFSENAARNVYGNVHIDAVKELIWHKNVISEKEYLELSEAYANVIEERGTKLTFAENMIKMYMKLSFSKKDTEETLQDFQLIKYIPSYQIFICKTEEDELILQKLSSILQERNKNLRKYELSKIKREVQERIVSVPYFRLKEGLVPPALLENYETLRFVSKEEVHTYYDEETGYKFFNTGSSETEVLIW